MFFDRRSSTHYVLLFGLLLAIFIPRLKDLGTILTIDEPLWMSRGQTFITSVASGQFAKTLVAGQPGVTTAWLAGLTAPSTSLQSKQAAIAIATGTLILLCTYALIQLYGAKWGFLIGYLLALDPFLLGHSRVVHTDALQALFYLASILFLLTALIPWDSQKRYHIRYLLLSGALGALAILTKLPALVVIPTTVLITGLLAWQRHQNLTTIIRTIGIWLTMCVLTTYIAWPALWFSADNVVDYLTGRASLHAEGTRDEETTSFEWYYLREAAFRLATPTAILLPFGMWYVIRHRGRSAYTTNIILLAGVLYGLVLSMSSDKSDRYIMFSLLCFIPVAAMGGRQIITILKKATPTIITHPLAIPLLIALPVIYLAADDARLHPYYLAHFNRLYPIEATHKLGWGEGLEQAAEYLNAHAPNGKALSYYPRVLQQFYSGEVETITHIDDAQADYIIIYRSMFERGEDSAEEDILRNYLYSPTRTPEHIVTINGLPYVWIFKK